MCLLIICITAHIWSRIPIWGVCISWLFYMFLIWKSAPVEHPHKKRFIELEMPRGNNRNLVQGTVYLIPMAGGTSINKTYANYSGDSFTINLSDVPNGIYMVKISGSAVGASGTASVSVTLY